MRTARGQGGDIPRNRQHPLFRLTVTWPFPSQLMIGFTADYASGEVRFSDGELTSGGFFSRDSLPQIPRPPSIARGDDRRLAGRTHRQPNAPGKQPAGIKKFAGTGKSITFAPQKAGSVLTLRPGFPALLKRICLAYSSGPDGGIGRRVGLKHRWSNPCRFDPGSGYRHGERSDSLPFCVPPTPNSSFFTIQDHKLHIGFTIWRKANYGRRHVSSIGF